MSSWYARYELPNAKKTGELDLRELTTVACKAIELESAIGEASHSNGALATQRKSDHISKQGQSINDVLSGMKNTGASSQVQSTLISVKSEKKECGGALEFKLSDYIGETDILQVWRFQVGSTVIYGEIVISGEKNNQIEDITEKLFINILSSIDIRTDKLQSYTWPIFSHSELSIQDNGSFWRTWLRWHDDLKPAGSIVVFGSIVNEMLESSNLIISDSDRSIEITAFPSLAQVVELPSLKKNIWSIIGRMNLVK